MKIFSYIVLFIIILFGLTFAALNANPVSFNYYIGEKHISLSLLLIFTLGIGIILGFIVSLIPFFKLKKRNLKLKHRIKEVETEIENLRTLPIKDNH